MSNLVVFHVRIGNGTWSEASQSFTDTICRVARVPTQYEGKRGRWEAVKYKGKRYQLFGGIRTGHFISLDNPIKNN